MILKRLYPFCRLRLPYPSMALPWPVEVPSAWPHHFPISPARGVMLIQPRRHGKSEYERKMREMMVNRRLMHTNGDLPRFWLDELKETK